MGIEDRLKDHTKYGQRRKLTLSTIAMQTVA